ncbi:hypothetical protein BDY19DRAFT_919504 [Irpex rosettiformis]|uniref:Uncharacterized protein n=1 Tax=Irpex rosettiformis TaxID=378272 RepID=A0ACB8UHR5_9APHY|nr:hypothetical protein BDY19DRAFT_919504 [Irpex rosettiformis]
MSGPPTPPPSSALELEDAARTTAAIEATLPTTVPPGPDAQEELTEQPADPAQPVVIPPPSVSPINPYKQAFTAIIDLASHDRFEELAQNAESADLNVIGDNRPERLLVTVPLVLSYLILDDIPPAIHALSRLPNSLTACIPLPRVLLSLVVAVSGRKYQNVYTLATKVHEALDVTETPEGLKPIVTLLLDKFLDRYRRKTFELLSRAYTSVPLSLVQSYLTLSPEQILEVAAQYKWGYDSSTQTLSPTPLPRNKGVANIGFGHSTLVTFNAIADLKLE